MKFRLPFNSGFRLWRFLAFRRRKHWFTLLLTFGLIIFVLKTDIRHPDLEQEMLEAEDRRVQMVRHYQQDVEISNNIMHVPPESRSASIENTNNLSRVTDLIITRRYWELTNSSLVKVRTSDTGDFGQLLKNSKESEDSGTSYNLWRPRNFSDTHGLPVIDTGDRVLAQLALVKEDFNKTPIGNFEKKTILLTNSFDWWNVKNSAECLVGCPQFADKCEFVGRITRAISRNLSAAIIVPSRRARRPSFADPDKMFVFYFILESTFIQRAILKSRTDILTSYWRGSGLITPYGKWAYYDPAVKRQKQGKNYAEGKTKLVAAFVSNCYPINTRAEYIDLLKQYIPVHVYGFCGSYECSKENQNQCFDKLKNEYKFYLSFENANCRDYITEKFWMNALPNDVVPIVMGAHPDDYRAVSPEYSYIHIEEFKRPKELADYLMYLDKNDAEYNKYFEWKGTGDFVNGLYFCRVCAMLHYAEIQPPANRTEAFNFGPANLCLPSRQTYWTSASWGLE